MREKSFQNVYFPLTISKREVEANSRLMMQEKQVNLTAITMKYSGM